MAYRKRVGFRSREAAARSGAGEMDGYGWRLWLAAGRWLAGGGVIWLGGEAALQRVQGQLLLAQAVLGLAALLAGAADAVIDGKALPAGFFGLFKTLAGGVLFGGDAAALGGHPWFQGRALGRGGNPVLGGLRVGRLRGAVAFVQRGRGAGGQQGRGGKEDEQAAHGSEGGERAVKAAMRAMDLQRRRAPQGRIFALTSEL